jgi:transposase-like protein
MPTVAETQAVEAWKKYKHTAEPLGIDFGTKMYALRKEISARGCEGAGLAAWLKDHGIPRSTAYFWINQYEELIGERQPKLDPVTESDATESDDDSGTETGSNDSDTNEAGTSEQSQPPEPPEPPLLQPKVIEIKKGMLFRHLKKTFTVKADATVVNGKLVIEAEPI